MGSIIAVCKDVGGANSILPVVDLLKTKNQIKWIAQADGRGREILQKINCDFKVYFSGIPKSEKIDAVISSMCSTAGQEIARGFKGFCPIITIQDYWANGLYNVWTDPEFRPDYVLVNDELDKNFVLQAWSDFDPSHIVITGYPALDRYVNIDVQWVKMAVKNKLHLSEDKPVVLFTGQWWQTGHAINELVRALNELRRDVYLIARPHPAMKDRAPEEVVLWEQALAKFQSGIIVESSDCDISEVVSASDLVISMYSATLNEAATLRLPNIAILYPDHGLKVYIEVTKSDQYPMVALGCTAKAGNYGELFNLVKTALTSGLDLRSAQEKVFNLDGNNSLRAANFISSLIKPSES